MQYNNQWLIKTVSITISTSILLQLIGVVTGILTARLLGPEGKGQLTAVMIWPMLLSSIGNLGITEAVKYFASTQINQRKYIYANSIYFALCQSILLVGVGYIFGSYIHHGAEDEILLAGRLFLLFIPFNLLSLYQHHFLAGRSDFVSFNFIRIVVSGSILIGILILTLSHRISVLNAVIVYLIGNLITTIATFIFAFRTREYGFRFSKLMAIPMLTYGIKSHSGNIGTLLNERLDQLLISLLLVPLQLGFYAVAVTLSAGVLLIGNSVSMVAMPVIASQSNLFKKKVIFLKFFRFSFWLSVLFALFFVMLMPKLVLLFFGAEFLPAVNVARVIILATIPLSMNRILQAGLKALNQPLDVGASELIGLFVTGFLIVILLPTLGIMGAAITSFLAYTTSFLFMMRKVSTKLGHKQYELFVIRSNDFKTLWLLLKVPYKKCTHSCYVWKRKAIKIQKPW